MAREFIYGILTGGVSLILAIKLYNSKAYSCLRGKKRNKLALIGAGPGHPELITVRALSLLSEAQVVIVDALVNPEIWMKHADSSAKIIYVGKRGGKKDSVPQTEIDSLLVKHGKTSNVVRLKGGDPMIYGRIASEIEALNKAGIEYEIVPGVSSILAAPAMYGIPLTHKELSKTFVVASGHDPKIFNYNALAMHDTIVLLMATRTLSTITDELINAGMDRQTPVAVIHQATIEQWILCGELENIFLKLKSLKSSASPAIVLIGKVAAWGQGR